MILHDANYISKPHFYVASTLPEFTAEFILVDEYSSKEPQIQNATICQKLLGKFKKHLSKRAIIILH